MSNQSSMINLEFIEMLFEHSKVEIDNEQYQSAIETLQLAFIKLGFSYVNDGVDYSTDLKIIAAEEMIKQGNYKNAANLMLKMLEIRIQLYKDKFNIE